MKTFPHHIKHAALALLNILFPPRCMLCQDFVSEAGALCSSCWNKLDFTTTPCCAVCSHPFDYEMGKDALCAACLQYPPAYKKAHSVFRYNAESKALIHRFKYSDALHLARHFAAWMERAGKSSLENADILVPVPLHYRRLISRRYNQAVLLCQELSKLSELPVQPDLLIRTKHTAPQHGLSRKERQKNVKGIFKLNPKCKPIHGKHIILIDDVMTTGATINQCCKILKRAGATVTVLTLARTIITS